MHGRQSSKSFSGCHRGCCLRADKRGHDGRLTGLCKASAAELEVPKPSTAAENKRYNIDARAASGRHISLRHDALMSSIGRQPVKPH